MSGTYPATSDESDGFTVAVGRKQKLKEKKVNQPPHIAVFTDEWDWKTIRFIGYVHKIGQVKDLAWKHELKFFHAYDVAAGCIYTFGKIEKSIKASALYHQKAVDAIALGTGD